MDTDLKIEKRKFFLSLAKALIVTAIIALAFILNDIFSLQWNQYGMKPRTAQGLTGILTMPFLHANARHLLSNLLPLFFFCFGLYYFFKGKATVILIMLTLATGVLTWAIGRDGVHVGASGTVYALAFFLVTISLIKRESSLLAYTLIIVFLYGSMVWGFFPLLFPDQHISWEGHLAGAVSGILLAFYYRKEGPERKRYFEDEEEDEEPENDVLYEEWWTSSR